MMTPKLRARPELVAQMRLLKQMVATEIEQRGAMESFMVRAGLFEEILTFALDASATPTEGGDPVQQGAPFMGGAVPEGETPNV